MTHALQNLPIPHFSVHQNADAGVMLRMAQPTTPLGTQAGAALESVFGKGHVTVRLLTADDKTLQYSSDLDGAHG